MDLVLYRLFQTWQSLRTKPGLIFSVVVSMGLTLGALLAVSALAYVIFIKTLPFPDAERLYLVEHQLINEKQQIDGRAFTYPNLEYLYKQQQVFDKSASFYVDAGIIMSLPKRPMAEISYVTPEYFQLLNPAVALGRLISDNEGVDQYKPVAVISYRLWQQQYGGSEDVLSQSLNINDQSFQIIGVLAKLAPGLAIAGYNQQSDVYAPWDFNTVDARSRKRWGNDDGGLMMLGLLKTSITPEQANQQLTQLMNNNWQQQVSHIDFFKEWSVAAQLQPLKDYLLGDSQQAALLLFLGSIGLAIIALANLTNLLLSRTAERQHPLAISAALGASIKHIRTNVFTEIMLLMTMAMTVAQGVMLLLIALMQQYLTDYLPYLQQLHISGLSLLFSALLLVVISVVLTLICSRTIDYQALNNQLRGSGKGTGVAVKASTRHWLISSQIAIACLLLMSNSLLTTQSLNLLNQPLGYQTDNIKALVTSVPEGEGDLALLKQRLAQHPQVERLSQSMRPDIFPTLALSNQADNARFSVLAKPVDEAYFSLLEQPLLQGAMFTAQDNQQRNSVIVVNQAFADRIKTYGEVIGYTFDNGARIVGIVANTVIAGSTAQEPAFYYPAGPRRNMFLIKFHQGASLSQAAVQAIMTDVQPQLSVFSYQSLDYYNNQGWKTAMITAVSSVGISLLTALLTGVGIYGVLSYICRMRRTELGTRLAIGAKPLRLVQLMMATTRRDFLLGASCAVMALVILMWMFDGYQNIQLVSELLPIIALSLLFVGGLLVIAAYLPLRIWLKQPIAHLLKGE
ncbi:ABC transporter permease [Neptunicella marina]|uniref:ABC transporter permease n=1 Tax=Neptunicella marina TaxID=2125989 RepID=A0A8J6ITT6_9ALTE|nr:ABC transporter permease [Neptunicella marina]MBC3765720.1 ABC transporter permease [Neptunicella marina]